MNVGLGKFFRYRSCFIVLAVVVAVFFLSGCGVQAEAILGADRGARITVQVALHPIMAKYIADLSGAMGQSGAGPVDLGVVKDRLAKEPGVTVQSVQALPGGGVDVRMQVRDIQQLFSAKSPSVASMFSFQNQQGGEVRLSFSLDRQGVRTLLGMGMIQEQDAASLLPQDASITAKEYRAQMEWALEEYGDKAALDAMFRSSIITLSLTLPRPVQSASGFIVRDKSAGRIEASLPVLDVLTLQKAVVFEVVY